MLFIVQKSCQPGDTENIPFLLQKGVICVISTDDHRTSEPSKGLLAGTPP